CCFGNSSERNVDLLFRLHDCQSLRGSWNWSAGKAVKWRVGVQLKRLFLLIGLLLGALSSTAQEGVPVKSLNGAGPPNANMAHVVGTEYIDISANPPVLYVR